MASKGPRTTARPRGSPATRAKAWLVTGPLGRGLAFAIDFGVALRTNFGRRR
jgi:hypothetical protein